MRNKRYYPFETVWRGHIQAKGIFFPFEQPYTHNLQKKIMRFWQPNIRLYEHEDGVLLITPSTFETQAEHLSGWALCPQGKGFSSVPVILPQNHSN